MKLKKLILAMSLSVAASSASFAQGIPTIDAAGLVQALIMVQSMADQVENQISQIEKLDAQISTMSGSRGMGSLMNDPTLRHYLPENWQGVYDEVKNGGFGVDYQKIYDQYGVKTDNEHAIALYQTDAANTALLRSSYESTLKRLNNIEGLLRQVDSTVDIKAAADLQNRIAAEQAIIQNEQNRLNLMMRLADAERQAQQEKARLDFVNIYLK